MNDFRVGRGAVFQGQADNGLLLVEALPSRSAGVQEQHIIHLLHTLDPEDVAMSAHEYIGRVGSELCAHATLPGPRTSGDVRHPDVDTAKGEPLVLGRPVSNIPAVDVAENARHRCNRLQRIDDR